MRHSFSFTLHIYCLSSVTDIVLLSVLMFVTSFHLRKGIKSICELVGPVGQIM
jgi:hypothetical protein